MDKTAWEKLQEPEAIRTLTRWLQDADPDDFEIGMTLRAGDIRKVRDDIAALQKRCEAAEREREEHERLKRTVKFMEEQYLAGHGGSWGICQYKQRADTAEVEVRELQNDKERLDWLQQRLTCNGVFEAVQFWPTQNTFTCANVGAKNAYQTVREAIDAARSTPEDAH